MSTKNIIILISVSTIWWCPCVESSLVLLEEGVCYDQCILLAKLLTFALLHFVLQDQTCLLLHVSLDFILLYFSPLWWKCSAAQLIAQAGQQAAAQLKVYPSQQTAKQKEEKKDPQVVIAVASTSYCLLIVSLLPRKGWDQFPHQEYWCLIPYTY